MDERTGNLPVETSRLIGRSRELSDLERLCAGSRLVTITGVGGVGKTRLALRAATTLAPRFADGAWWAALSPLAEDALLPFTIAQALPLADQTPRTMIEVVTGYLAGREVLLILDTCEHLSEACARIARIMLAAAPRLRILATSRRPLGVPGEGLLPLAPLPVPHGEGVGARSEDALTLLAERAAEAVPGFTVTGADRPEVVRLCRRLDGLPLAIELAAARLAEMPLAEMNDRMEDRFEVLEDVEQETSAADPPWHRGLRTAIGWSHELCTPHERLLWARASVFAGSFGVGTTAQVCADRLLPAVEIPELLDALADKSILIQTEAQDGVRRFRMLDSIRAYGTFWLRGLGEHHGLAERHRDHYLALAGNAATGWLGPDQLAWCRRLTADHDDLRAALEFCLAHPEDDGALELAGTLWFFWYACGFPKEGQRYLERALALDPGAGPSPVRNRVLWALALVLLSQGDIAAGQARAAECAAAADRIGDSAGADGAQVALACAAAISGDLPAQISLSEAMLARRRDDGTFCLPALYGRLVRGIAYITQGRPKDAIVLLEELRALCERHNEHWVRGYSDVFRAQAELAAGDPAAAYRSGQAALAGKHRLNDRLGAALALDMLGPAALALGRHRQAAHLFGLAQRVWDTIGRSQVGITAWVAARRAGEDQARRALGEAAYRIAYRTGYDTDVETGIAQALDAGPALPAH
ncbi:LuxR family transcriptional regulator [Spirillospora sp. NPDC047279]|uniref:ATP-binding protein n=1 Tax=Spirillospora sp. NPDC047279 TaxID=3155478 RepID=UPI0033CEABE7